MTAGFYSPLPPARTGVADYSAALLTQLRKYGRVEVSPARCDIALYHTGNNGLHAAIYQRALAVPGVTVLHDAVLHHFLLGQLDEAAYVEEFVYNYGEWYRGLAGELWRGRASSGSESRYFQYPMLRRVAERSLATIVHNPAAAGMVRAHAPQATVIEIPHLFEKPPGVSIADALRYRQRIGIDPAAFVFGVFGYLRESKRVAQTLDAFCSFRRELPRTALLIAGDFASRDLERALAPLMHGPGVVRLAYLPEREFWLAASAVDACINLKYPAAGETSGIAIRLMGLGKPVFMSDSRECSMYPADACLRVPAGAAEKASLIEYMRMLACMRGVAEAIGARAKSYIEEHHAAERVGKQYWEVLAQTCADKLTSRP